MVWLSSKIDSAPHQKQPQNNVTNSVVNGSQRPFKFETKNPAPVYAPANTNWQQVYSYSATTASNSVRIMRTGKKSFIAKHKEGKFCNTNKLNRNFGTDENLSLPVAANLQGKHAPAPCPKETCIIHAAITLRSILPRSIL